MAEHKQGNGSPLVASALGRETDYPQQYDPEVLYPVPRQHNRDALQVRGWPWFGFDLWYAYELSWLNERGLPQVALAALTLPADSPYLIESKSLKLYLNSFNMTRFASAEAVRERMVTDLSARAGGPVQVRMHGPEAPLLQGKERLAQATLLDTLDIATEQYELDSSLLALAAGGGQHEACLYSHLLRSNCPVTGQPDWGSVVIDYAGPALDLVSVLRYLVSFRNHTGFHEDCVERIFTDLLALGDFSRLVVSAHYLRRGGLDINPCRSLQPLEPDMGRWARQ
ncbi:NADPH-dependent 7-cyano-7-deazaguanine reductase QueF [Natronospirillum operosum]|uniref:NADPH-dependent 7-cyano-7-deazaguanine reductase n=1 Tax=Natronospirillum operosum TaxID=2759953 RepID=A0A4Z0WJ88_9GAMM|nr:NADPH-dependent 7-cyano-7-deazaguanine reductase QueF [Natronospirillum operosum]TGG95877.1 NADPH-dependent 7-cyano-7-deazaguanine reductase QueF [Natronospirillum operosum]